MKKLYLASSLVFLLAMVYTVAAVAEIPGAVLILDAAVNPGHPDVWTNVGTAGGELTAEGTPSALDLAMPGAMFDTGDQSGEAFGGIPARGSTVVLFPEVWTMEFLCRRNGRPLVGIEHFLEQGFAGVQTVPVQTQGLRLGMKDDPEVSDVPGEVLDLSIHSQDKRAVEPIRVTRPEGVWTWVTIVGTSGDPLVA